MKHLAVLNLPRLYVLHPESPGNITEDYLTLLTRTDVQQIIMYKLLQGLTIWHT